MHPTDKAARIAGAVYLSMVITAPFSLIYVPSKLIVRGNATATAANILANETLYRFGIVADLIGSVIFIALAVALYRLFAGVNRTRALEMVSLILVSAAVGFMNVLNHIAALILFRGADFLTVFQKPQRDALGMLFIRLYGQGIVINELFWGLWLFPFALLVIQSRFLPRRRRPMNVRVRRRRALRPLRATRRLEGVAQENGSRRRSRHAGKYRDGRPSLPRGHHPARRTVATDSAPAPPRPKVPSLEWPSLRRRL